MRFAAFEEHSADVHGNYEHWHLPCERGSESEPDAAYDPYDDLMQAAPEDGNLFMVKVRVPIRPAFPLCSCGPGPPDVP